MHSLVPLTLLTLLQPRNSQNPNMGHVLIVELATIILLIGPNSPIIERLIEILSGDVIELLIYHQPSVKPSLTLHPFGILGYVAGHSLTDITTVDGQILKAIGMGDLHLDLPNGSKRTPVIFKNAIHTPKMAFTLLSISKLDKSDHRVVFHKQMCTISDSKGCTIAKIPHSEGLYRVQAPEQPKINLIANATVVKMSINKAHCRLGHISSAAIKHAIAKGFITGIDLDESSKLDFCEACVKAKSARQLFPQESKMQADKYGEYVHWDLWGPASVKSLNGHYYVAARIDDTTRETRLYFQEKKSETFSSYKKDEAYIGTQTRNHIKTVRSDCGGEFMSVEFIKYQDSKGTVRQLTVHDSLQQNGVAERGMQTQAERACAMLISSGLPRFLWEEAMHHTTWLQN